ncbi:MAG: NAD-dependent epimerase/dehydratase family protein [Candidatus Parvarchaeota archaeon]
MESRIIVVTGANGFIGANLSRHFSSLGHEVYSIVRKGSDLWRLTNHDADIEIVSVNEYRIDVLSDVLHKIHPEVVANSVGADQAVTTGNPETNWDSNFMSLVRLVHSLKGLSVDRLIHAGSSFEYGNVNQGNLLSENLECSPVSEYATSKLIQSHYLKYASKNYSLPSIVLRIFNVFGPYESLKRLIPYLIVKALKNEKIFLMNPQVMRDFIFVQDVMRAFEKSLGYKAESNYSVFNVGTGIGTKVHEVANLISKILGKELKINYELGDFRPENSIQGPIADISLAKKELKWLPLFSLQEALKEDIKWFSTNLNQYEKL